MPAPLLCFTRATAVAGAAATGRWQRHPDPPAARPGPPAARAARRAGARDGAARRACGAARGGAGAGERRRRRGQTAASRFTGAGGCEASGIGLRGPRRAARGVRARRAERLRRREGESAAAAPDLGGEKVGEGEEVAGKLTTVRFEAEDGRRSGSTERGWSSTRTSMVAATETPDSVGKQLERA